MKHKEYIKNYEHLGDLADEIGNLRYDKLSDFLYYLSLKLKNDSVKDKEKNKNKLSDVLLKSSKDLYNASDNISLAWKICKPFEK